MKRAYLFFLLLCAGCFGPWTVDGLYRCGGGCPKGFTCDDGVCCVLGGSPACPTLVLDGGTCPGGGAPKVWYADNDHDGYGDPNSPRVACNKPLSSPYVEDNTDCDDTSAAAHPGGTEVCDGHDNNCNGLIDEGQSPLTTYYKDVDGDGYGDSTMTLMACDCSTCVPPGYSSTAGDCAPMDPSRHPNATEQCNGLDDNCNNAVDEPPVVGTGVACTDAGIGLCANGTTDCIMGSMQCASSYTPMPDVCDGQDNNCDGQVDERPDCGGPTSFLDPGVVTGAQDVGPLTFIQETTKCLKDWPGFSVDAWAAPTWNGSNSDDHIWYAEAAAGKTWDLSKGFKINLSFSWTMTFGASSGDWASEKLPVVYLCDANGTAMERLVHIPGTLLTDTPGIVTTVIDSSALSMSAWDVGASTGLDLTKVKRMEMMVTPKTPASQPPYPSFMFTFFADAGFE